ncbi:MAG: flagellar basal body-associated protein FliL [Roseinatronobacter sp.]
MAQTETADPESPETPRKRRLLPVLAGLIAALLLGGGSFYAVYSGLILGPSSSARPVAALDMDFAYIPLDNITISLVSPGSARLLRFSGQIEVAASSEADMLRMQPRFLDLVNTYLHAVDPADLEAPAALIRLRAQILRRLQVVAGDGHVRDFLITEFVLSQVN